MGGIWNQNSVDYSNFMHGNGNDNIFIAFMVACGKKKFNSSRQLQLDESSWKDGLTYFWLSSTRFLPRSGKLVFEISVTND